MKPLVLIGFMGSGKTTTGRRVAEMAGTDFLDLDDVIVARAGMTVAAIFAAGGEPLFRRLEREAFRDAIAPDRVVALGGGAPMQDETWREVRERCVSVFLDAPLEVLRARIGDGEGRPLAAGDLEGLLEGRLSRYREADHAVDAARGVDEVAREVVRLWSA